jgi:hypothetical protein
VGWSHPSYVTKGRKRDMGDLIFLGDRGRSPRVYPAMRYPLSAQGCKCSCFRSLDAAKVDCVCTAVGRNLPPVNCLNCRPFPLRRITGRFLDHLLDYRNYIIHPIIFQNAQETFFPPKVPRRYHLSIET